VKKLINGIVEFRRKARPEYAEVFAKLALEQKPDTLFIACSDSRVVPNLFASTDPGDLFVIRNVGNLVCPCDHDGRVQGDESEVAAIELALAWLPVVDIVVCGHSECGAMRALAAGREDVRLPHVRSWLRHGEEALRLLKAGADSDKSLPLYDQLSQQNVLQQLEHLRTHPTVRDRLQAGTLRLHAWWFDIRHADVYAFEPEKGRFVILDEEEAARMMARMPG